MLKTVGNPSTRYGDQTIIDGNLVIGTAGKGIDFSATPGTGTSELFDDYEEGTWSPTLHANGTDFTSVTYAAGRGGKYTKIGNVVHIQGIMVTDAVTLAGAAGTVQIGGLPFAVAGTTVNGWVVEVLAAGGAGGTAQGFVRAVPIEPNTI